MEDTEEEETKMETLPSDETVLVTALQNLDLDPLFTKSYRADIKCLNNITVVLKEIHDVQMCCPGNIVKKFTIDTTEFTQDMENNFVPTVEVYKFLTEKAAPVKFNTYLKELLWYILIKLDRSEDARTIFQDFKELLDCIQSYREYSTWDNTTVDQMVTAFLKKLIDTMQELTVDSNIKKFDIFSLRQKMIMEFGKHPFYSTAIVKHLVEKISQHYLCLKVLPPNVAVDEYVFENHCRYLYILSDIVGRNLIKYNEEEGKAVLLHLQIVLNDLVALNRMRPIESYLVQNILGIIVMYLAVKK